MEKKRDVELVQAAREQWNDGTPAECFYTASGREIMHRRYVGPEAPASGRYDYERLPGETTKLFRGKEYRLWYDTVLMSSGRV